MSEWISVKDRLPAIHQAVIAAKWMGDEWWYGYCIYRDYGFPWVQLDNPNPVTHWMPLPPPPEGE